MAPSRDAREAIITLRCERRILGVAVAACTPYLPMYIFRPRKHPPHLELRAPSGGPYLLVTQTQSWRAAT